MSDGFEVDGKKLHARTCTADEWFDAVDLLTPRDQDYALVSICIVDDDGNKVYEPADVGKLPVTTYTRLYDMAEKAIRPEEAEKK